MDGADSCRALGRGTASNLSMNAIIETMESLHIVNTAHYYRILQITTTFFSIQPLLHNTTQYYSILQHVLNITWVDSILHNNTD